METHSSRVGSKYVSSVSIIKTVASLCGESGFVGVEA